MNNLLFGQLKSTHHSTVPADETVEPKDLVLLLPLLIIAIKSSKRKENRDWTPKKIEKKTVFWKLIASSSNISGATRTRTMYGFLPKLAWKTSEAGAKESCEHGELLHFAGVQNIPWWRKQKRLNTWAVPNPPNPHCTFRYCTQPRKTMWIFWVGDQIFVFHFVYCYTNSNNGNVCTHGIGSKSWFGFWITRSSVKVLFLHIQHSKNGINQLWPSKAADLIFLSSRVRWLQEISIDNLFYFYVWRKGTSTWILLGATSSIPTSNWRVNIKKWRPSILVDRCS